jgi:diaminopimelate epimerase
MPTYGQYDVPNSDTMVNLGVGQPDNRVLPLNLVKDAMRKFIDEENNPEVLQYGDIPGYKRFRIKVADWLSKQCYQDIPDTLDYQRDFEFKVNEDELFITNGVTHALHLIMTAHMYQEDTILVEDPTYFIMINIFKEFGLNVMPINMENDGIDIAMLDDTLTNIACTQEKVFLYTIPINHNPTGITMCHQKRIALAELCNKYNNFYIIADEVYHFLSWEDQNEKLLPLADYHPNITSIGSFSKILAPSLRLGWIYQNIKFPTVDVQESLLLSIINCGLYDSTGGTGVISSYITEVLIDNGELNNYIKECQQNLCKRTKVICDGLVSLREKGLIEFKEPNGGYFVWIKVNNISADDLLLESIKNKVKFHPGWKFTCNSNEFNNCIRLSVSYYDEVDLKIGVDRLTNTILNFNKINIAVLGANGRLGKLIVEEIKKNDMFVFVGGIIRDMDLAHLTHKHNLIIDVSSPEGTHELINKLNTCNLKIPLLIGTTGDHTLQTIVDYATKAPVALISNFSDGLAIINQFSNIINNLSDEWKFNMEETHHINKKDAPSGTATSWCNTLNRDCLIDSIREGDVFGKHKLILSSPNEDIVIQHTSKNRNIFAEGCMKYVDWIMEQKSGLYDKINFLKYKHPRIRKYSATGNVLIIAEFINQQKWSNFVSNEALKDKDLDGVIFIERFNNHLTKEMNTKWTYYNRDGSQVPFCGNGVRCIGKYLGENYKELTGSIVNPSLLVSNYKIEDSNIYFNSPIPVKTTGTELDKLRKVTNEFEFIDIHDISIVSIGVPHIVIECNCNIFELDESLINYVSNSIHTSFSSNYNINFVNVIDDTNFRIRTYERGVDRETGSCGSGCLASFYHLYNTKKLLSNCSIHLVKDGILNVYVDTNDTTPKYHLGGIVNKLN